MMLVVGDGDNEKRFRQLYRTALGTEVTPALTALGFEARAKVGGVGTGSSGTKTLTLRPMLENPSGTSLVLRRFQ